MSDSSWELHSDTNNHYLYILKPRPIGLVFLKAVAGIRQDVKVFYLI